MNPWRLDLEAEATQCKVCPAKIVFAETGNKRDGKPVRMPVDVIPDPAGNVLLSRTRGKLYAGVLRANQAAGAAEHEHLHMPHWKTCTNPELFRRKLRDEGEG